MSSKVKIAKNCQGLIESSSKVHQSNLLQKLCANVVTTLTVLKYRTVVTTYVNIFFAEHPDIYALYLLSPEVRIRFNNTRLACRSENIRIYLPNGSGRCRAKIGQRVPNL